MLTVVGLLEFDRRDVAAVRVQAPVVLPVDPFQHADLDLLGDPLRASWFEQFGLNNPIVVSARALLHASLTDPTDGSAPSAGTRSVHGSDTYCDPASE